MKKILLVISMFLFMTNVKALTFNVDLTNIEDKGNNGTIGSITNIDIPSKTIDAYFQDIGDEVSFDLTISNTGDRAGTLKSITVSSTSESIEYTNNLPETGLAINGNDSNTVTITAKVKEGAVNGTSSSEITIKYNYDEGSCPEGETLSEDESMCLCPEGYERNEQGVCVKPEKKIECADDEIYNETKKICEKKVTPTPDKKITPSNPKTLDNIVLITLLFIVSGLGIYAVLYKKLKTKKKKITVGVITGVITLGLSFTILAGVFGLDDLLSAIVNPITKSKEIIVTVNEEIDLIETWDGNCDLETAGLTPDNIFAGGSGTESDPYKIKTAEQLSCFAKSINNGTTYEGQYIKQIKNIKLNNNLIDNITSGNTSGLNLWTSAGVYYDGHNIDNSTYPHFSGTYDGDNHIISGLYITNDSTGFGTVQDDWGNTRSGLLGMFGHVRNAEFKNMILSDVYMNTTGNTGALIGAAARGLNIDNVKTYGSATVGGYSAGFVSSFFNNDATDTMLKITNSENNINITSNFSVSGFVHYVDSFPTSDEPNMVFINDVNKGNFNFAPSIAGGITGYVRGSANVLIDNCSNTGDFTFDYNSSGSMIGGISGELNGSKITITNSYNTGNWSNMGRISQSGGLVGTSNSSTTYTVDNCYNSGNMTYVDVYPDGLSADEDNALYTNSYVGGLFGYLDGLFTITNSYNTGDIAGPLAYGAGIVGHAGSGSGPATMENCYNTGNITGKSYSGGVVGYYIGTITKVYNTGDVIVFGGPRMGGIVGWGGGGSSMGTGSVHIYNSYNTGNLLMTAERGNQMGGLCAADCGEIKNSYNTGNITSKYSGVYMGGITGQGGYISNSYNSGIITFLNEVKPSGDEGQIVYAGGITGSSPGTTTNTYNLGDINIYQNGGITARGFEVGGISVFGAVDNSVNKGNITATINEPYSGSYRDLYIGGISFSSQVTNSFNAGTITLDDSALDHSIYDEEIESYGYIYKHNIFLGEILAQYNNNSSGNKWNTNSNANAFGCAGDPNWSNCTIEKSQAAGQYTTETEPSILSIINGDDAFEIKEGETLPTLKIFNE